MVKKKTETENIRISCIKKKKQETNETNKQNTLSLEVCNTKKASRLFIAHKLSTR